MRIPTVMATDVAADAYLLDVREFHEWDAGHAPGATHLPMMEIPARLTEVPNDREVVVVCRVGGRSGQVVAYLIHHGWSNVTNLDGGMIGWAAAGKPVITDNGRVPEIV